MSCGPPFRSATGLDPAAIDLGVLTTIMDDLPAICERHANLLDFRSSVD
jgi:hypothetical protein